MKLTSIPASALARAAPRQADSDGPARGAGATSAANIAEQRQLPQDAVASMRNNSKPDPAWIALCDYVKGSVDELPPKQSIPTEVAKSVRYLSVAALVDELGVTPDEAAQRLKEVKEYVQP